MEMLHKTNMMIYIGLALLLYTVNQVSSDRSLNLAIIVDHHDGMENWTVVKIEQFVVSVANETFAKDPNISIAVLQPSCSHYSDRTWYGFHKCFISHMNLTTLQNSVSFLSKTGRPPYNTYYFAHHFWAIHNFLTDHRSNDTAEMIFMISDGYHPDTKENAQKVLKEDIAIAAIIRTDNNSEIDNMDNATGDPSLVLPIASFDDLPSIVDDSVQIILTGKRNTSGVPNYEVSQIDVEHNLNWENDLPVLSFVCNFQLSSASHDLIFSVTWYVNRRIIGQDRLFRWYENEKHVLSEKELTDNGYYHGIHLQCGFSAKFSSEGRSGKRYYSGSFFAGIEVLTKSINLEKNGEALLKFRPTVPFACEKDDNECLLSVQMEIPESKSCQGNAVVRSSGRCRVDIPGYNEENKAYYSQTSNWKLVYNLTVNHTQSTSFDRDSFYTIGLVTSWVFHKFWRERHLSNIPVHIYTGDISWQGSYCYSHIDPHDRTFDARHFEQQNIGRYIMYRNKKLDQEVQYETQSCSDNDRSPSCICGLAIRAGRDVFLMYFCDYSSIVDYVSCIDNTLTVESDRFSGYKVLFPSGTQVNTRISCWQLNCFMNVDIYPTGSDVDSTEGLCGNFDGDCNNDFLKRDGSYSSTVTTDACPPTPPYSRIFPDDFSESWRTNSDEDLFPPFSNDVYDNLNQWSQNLLLCSCKFEEVNGTVHTPTKTDVVDCSYKSYRDCVVSRYKPFTCDVTHHGILRKRREISERSKRSTKPSVHASVHQVSRRSTTMTEIEARYHCNNTLHSSDIYRLCLESVTEIDDSIMEDCVLDVKMTGDVNMSYVALQIVKDTCLTFVGKNTTLNDSSPDIVYAVQSKSCPSDCSQLGTCDNGVCDCQQGYGGDDCSVDLSDPPVVSGISQGEYCDVSETSCTLIKVYGLKFYSLTPRCRIEYEIIEESGVASGKNIVYLQGEQKSQFEAACNIQSIRSSVETGSTLGFVTSYTLSISNDNDTYSTNVTLVLYDSECQTRDETKGRFVLKDNYCYIENTCYYHESAHPSAKDRSCCSTTDPFDWYPSSECKKEGKPDKDGDKNYITIITVISMFLVVIITIVLILLYLKKLHCIRKVEDIQKSKDPIQESKDMQLYKLPTQREKCPKPVFKTSSQEATSSPNNGHQQHKYRDNTPSEEICERTTSMGSINITL